MDEANETKRPHQTFRNALEWAKASAKWTAEHRKDLLFAAIAIAVFIPRLYGVFVWCLPKANYEIGALGNPPNFRDLPGDAWNIDWNYVEGAPEGQQLIRVLSAKYPIIRLGKDGYKPGRDDFSGSANEVWGKQWSNPQCLFATSIRLVVISRSVNAKGRRFSAPYSPVKGDDTAYLSVDTATVRKDAGKTDLQTYYLGRLPSSVKGTACLKPAHGQVAECPRIAIWARGTPAPCSISIF